MNLVALFDAGSAAIVVGGTALATLLRCGPANCAQAFVSLAHLGRDPFDSDRARSEMAVQVREIQQDGLLRAQPHHTGDSEFDEATDALIGSRSVGALIKSHESHKARRMDLSHRAVSTLAQAAELAPVFGLAGTLISLSQLPADGIAKSAFAGSIAMAVQTTLYGLLLANLVFAPLARLVDRAAETEEDERQQIIDWLAGHVARELGSPRFPDRHNPRLDRAA